MTDTTPAKTALARSAISRVSAAGQPRYDADAIQMLEGLEAVRKRPGMYIGGTGSDGLSHLLWELIDNAVDEAAGSHANAVSVIFHEDGSFEVTDNGRGIPIDRHARKKVSALEVVFTELHAGGKFGGGAYTASGGLHGVGASVVNALARKLVVEVDRDGRTHRLSFQDRVAGRFDGGRFRKGHDLEVLGKVPAGRTGTRVRFWPDTDIFDADATIEYPAVRDRVAQMCFLVPDLEVALVDHRAGAGGQPERFSSKRGLVDYVEFLSVGDPLTEVIGITGEGTFEETVPVDGKMATVTRTCQVELALRWVKGYDTKLISFVNTIPTSDGGTHVAGLERAMTFALNDRLGFDEAKRLKKFKDEARATREDIQEGLVAVLKVTLPEPQFRGQTKRELGTPKVQSITYEAVKAGITDWVANGKKSHVNAVRDKLVAAIEARLLSRQQRETLRRASALGSTGLPDKLADCRSTQVGETELLIVEGDSAAGPTKAGRNSEFQAVLPIRGKILNAGKASLKQVLENAEAEAIFTVMGAGSGADFNAAAARYGRVVILADADVDGAHIRCLLLTLFYRYMRPMLEQGRIFVAMPPLFTITETRATATGTGADSGPRGAASKTPAKREKVKHFAYDDIERQRVCGELTARGVNYSVGRNKGLGEMDVDELARTALDPETRVLRRVTLDEAEAALAATAFDVLMGRDVGPRRDWIVERAAFVDRELLDI